MLIALSINYVNRNYIDIMYICNTPLEACTLFTYYHLSTGRSSNKNGSGHSHHRSSVTSPHSSTHRYRSPPRYSSSNSRRRSRSRSHSRYPLTMSTVMAYHCSIMEYCLNDNKVLMSDEGLITVVYICK